MKPNGQKGVNADCVCEDNEGNCVATGDSNTSYQSNTHAENPCQCINCPTGMQPHGFGKNAKCTDIPCPDNDICESSGGQYVCTGGVGTCDCHIEDGLYYNGVTGSGAQCLCENNSFCKNFSVIR